jgi:hypothetical protein
MRLPLATIILLVNGLTPVAFGQKVYWCDASGVHRADLDGEHAETVVNTAGSPQSVILDLAGGKMYWSEWLGGRIRRANLNGTIVEPLLEGISVGTVGFDSKRGKLYWTEPFLGRIRRANGDGSAAEVVVSGVSYPWALQVNMEDGKLFWSEDRHLWQGSLDGTDSHVIAGPTPSPIYALAADTRAGYLYWTEQGGAIYRVELNVPGTAPVTLVDTGSHAIPGIQLDVVTSHMYWTEANALYRADLTGGGMEVVLRASFPFGLALDLRECSGHGQRVKDQCVCDPDWAGDNCDCFTEGCPNGCSGQGECVCGVCLCAVGWSGPDCTCSTQCPGDCSGHGECVCGACLCDTDYTGNDCSCFTGGCPNDCSGQGTCDCGTCHCDPGWDGPDCSCVPQACPDDCSGHGACICGVCDCDPGWIQPDCSALTQSPSRVFLAPQGLQKVAAPMGPTTYLTPAGTTVSLMVWTEDVSPSGGMLNAYQLMWPWSATAFDGSTGTVNYVDPMPGPGGNSIFLDSARSDWIFASAIVLEAFYNETPNHGYFGLFYGSLPGTFVNPAELPGIHYLAEFDLEVSPDAQGVFELEFRLGSSPRSYLFRPDGQSYPVDEFQTLRLIVGQTQPLSSEPPHQAIDPRHGAGASADGGATLNMTYNGDTANVTTADFSVEVTGGGALQIADIEVDGNVVALVFDQPFPAGECTTIRHLPGDWHATIRALPGDVNGDGLTSPLDIFALVDHLNGVIAPPLKTWQCDLNLSGECEPSDILALIDLLNGANGGQSWNGAEAPQCP